MVLVREILTQWGAMAHDVALCALPNLALPVQKYTAAEAARWLAISPGFGPDAEFWLNPDALQHGGKIALTALNPENPKLGFKILLLAPAPGVQVFVGGDACCVFVGAIRHFVMHAMLWGGSRLFIGDAATCNGARAVLQQSSLLIGRDAMLSDEILLQSSPQHTLVDLASMTALNKPDQALVLAEHVWLGRRSMVMPGVRIGRGAILAAGAVAARNVPDCCAAAGVPAAVIREHVSWCRNDRNEVDAAELAAAGILPH